MTAPTLTDLSGSTPLLAPLIAQWRTSADMLFDRLSGLTDEEYRWPPAPGAVDLIAHPDGTLRIPADTPESGTRTIAWTLAHLADMCRLRADYTNGSKIEPLETQPFPGTAEEGLAEARRAIDRWWATLTATTSEQAAQVGYSSYPEGMDPDLPFVDIAWWMNRELIAHGSDAGTVRDLYAARIPQD